VRNASLQRRPRAIQDGMRPHPSEPGSGRRPRVVEGEGFRGSAHGLQAALTVDRFKGGRTDAEAAVDQAVSEAMPDVRDRRAKRERGSGALLWSMVLLSVACRRLRVPSLQSPRRIPLAPCRSPRGLHAATDGFNHGRGRLWRLWSGTRAAERLWHLVRLMPRRLWPVARERVVSELTPQRSDKCVGPPRPSRGFVSFRATLV
jgi:hypothetical protein